MIRKTGMALLLGVSMIAGCEKKEEKPAADAVKSVTDAAKGAADSAKGAVDSAKAKTEEVAKDVAKDASAARDAAIAEVQKLIDPIKKEAEALYTKAAAKVELKPLVEGLKSEIGGLEKLVADAKTSDKWSGILADAKGKLDAAKKMVADLTAKLK